MCPLIGATFGIHAKYYNKLFEVGIPEDNIEHRRVKSTPTRFHNMKLYGKIDLLGGVILVLKCKHSHIPAPVRFHNVKHGNL